MKDAENLLLYLDKKEHFKVELKNFLTQIFLKAKLFSEGSIEFSSEWKDWLGQAVIGTGVIMSAAVIAALVAAGLLIAIPGITIPISIAGVGAGIAYNMYRTKKKKKEYQRIAHLINNASPEDIETIINHLADLYQDTIVFLTAKDMIKFAQAIALTITRAMRKGQVDCIDQLMNSNSLYTIIYQQRNHIPVKKIHTDRLDGYHKRNTASAMTKPGILCDGKIWVSAEGKPYKYGLIKCADEESEDLENNAQLHPLRKMSRRETRLLIERSIFAHYEKKKISEEEDSLLYNLNI